MKGKQIIKAYFVGSSILAHCMLMLLLIFLLSNRITDHWWWGVFKRWLAGPVDQSEVYLMAPNGFESLPTKQWIKIHQQTPKDEIHFLRQANTGSAFDNRRGYFLLFGGNTDPEDWSNTVYAFDMGSLQWHTSYPIDSPDTYAVNAKGVPVAGSKGDHPWAMYTFGGVEYDLLHDSLVVASYPKQLAPDKKHGQNFAHIWKLIKQHPTWIYSFDENKWIAGDSKNISFYPYTMTYNSDRDVITGFRPDGVFDWSGEMGGWKKVANSSYSQWATNSVYDSIKHAFVLYGGNALKNDVYVYTVGDESTKKMPTPGERPPSGQSVPLAFHPKAGKTIAVVDAGETAQTWLYDLGTDRWERLVDADFPFKVGTNYNLEYDSIHNLIVFIASPPHEETAVWILKI